MMKLGVAAIVAGLATGPILSAAALAQTRPDTLRMSCGSAAETVRRSGAIVLATGPSIYDRYVSGQAFCQRDEEARPHWLATTDSNQCFIGYVCERRGSDPSPN